MGRAVCQACGQQVCVVVGEGVGEVRLVRVVGWTEGGDGVEGGMRVGAVILEAVGVVGEGRR